MTLDGFSALLFVPPAEEVLAEIKRMVLNCLMPPHSPIRAFTQSRLEVRFTVARLSH